MNIIVRCVKCKRDLKLIVLSSPNLQDQIYEISPCNNIDCYDCGKCEVGQKEITDANTIRNNIANTLIDLAAKISTGGFKGQSAKKEEPEKEKEKTMFAIFQTCADCKNIECLHYGHKETKACEKIILR